MSDLVRDTVEKIKKSVDKIRSMDISDELKKVLIYQELRASVAGFHRKAACNASVASANGSKAEISVSTRPKGAFASRQQVSDLIDQLNEQLGEYSELRIGDDEPSE